MLIEGGYDFIDKINVDRQFYAEVFSYLCKKENLIFNFSNFEAEKVIQQFDAYSFIMAVETFIELGIFSINKGLLKRNREVKNALTNSIMYSKILMIK